MPDGKHTLELTDDELRFIGAAVAVAGIIAGFIPRDLFTSVHRFIRAANTLPGSGTEFAQRIANMMRTLPEEVFRG